MTIQEFNNQMAELTNQALLNDVSPADVLLSLDSAAFDVRFSMFRQRQQQAMQAAANRIVPANHIPKTGNGQ